MQLLKFGVFPMSCMSVGAWLIPYSFLQDGKYREALGKWEAALALAPDVPVVHEQKAQVLLEIGDAWNALKAATRASLRFILLNLVYLSYIK